jgi:glycosyltransferase involved in cell wall biosynthesis
MPPHIGILAPDLGGRHGWSRYALDILRALRAADAVLTIITTHDSPRVEGIDALPLLPGVEPLPGGLLARQLAAYPAARQALASCGVIHSLIEPFAPLGALIAGRRPLVITGHGSYVRAHAMRRPPVSSVYALAFRRGVLACVSRYTEAAAQAALPGVRTVVIPNGVDAARFAALPRRPDAHAPLVLFVGAIKARKGVLHLVEAMRAVWAHHPAARCALVGALDAEPEYVRDVQRAIATLDAGDRIRLMGRVDEPTLDALYAQASVFVIPSRNVDWKFEGFGLALLEASAAGIPVIGSRGCGAEDAVIDGQTGLLIDQDEMTRGIADALITLLDDPVRAARLGEAGRAHAAVHTWARTAASLIALYGSGL